MIHLDLESLANYAQIASVVVPGAAVLVTWRVKNCNYPKCPRVGRFEIPDTTWWACPKHHTPEDRETLQALHQVKHPERLTH